MKPGKASILFMAVTAGLMIANLYYCQPLIPQIARDFGLDITKAARLTYLTQAGYIAGLLILIPLNVLLEGKRQMLVCAFAASLFLLLASVSPTFAMLGVCSVLLGTASVLPQQAFIWAMSSDVYGQKDRAIGLITAGLLSGVMAAHTLSGAVGFWFGWRIMYFLAAVICLGVMAGIWFLVPMQKPEPDISLYQQVKKAMKYVNTEPFLRFPSIINAISFAVLNAFWVVLFFSLTAAPAKYNIFTTGLLGLAGAAGVIAAHAAGKPADISQADKMILTGLICELISFVVFIYGAGHILLLAGGILLLGTGHQIIQATSHIRIYSAFPEACKRLNTVFMVSCFSGGVTGTVAGIVLWKAGGWEILCVGCFVLILINFTVHMLTKRSV